MEYNKKVKDELISQLGYKKSLKHDLVKILMEQFNRDIKSRKTEEKTKEIKKSIILTYFKFLLGCFLFFPTAFIFPVVYYISLLIVPFIATYLKYKEKKDDLNYYKNFTDKFSSEKILSIINSIQKNSNIEKIAETYYNNVAKRIIENFLLLYSTKASDETLNIRSDLKKRSESISFRLYRTNLYFEQGRFRDKKTIPFVDLGIQELPEDCHYIAAVTICVIEKLFEIIKMNFKNIENIAYIIYHSDTTKGDMLFDNIEVRIDLLCDNPNYIKPEDLKKW